ncbi:S-adenosylmethionine synthetase [Bradyrhizobium sp. i1.7.7]
MRASYLFTSESVSEGHPDKVCDRISDEIVDLFYREGPKAGIDPWQIRAACETLATTNKVVIAGETRGPASVTNEQIEGVVRAAIKDIGYEQDGFHWEKADIEILLHPQSADIAQGVDALQPGEVKEEGAGDQGIMFGYATNETPDLMPAPIFYAHKILRLISEARHSGREKVLGPDSKSQVTVQYENGKPVGVREIVVSHQHLVEDISSKQIRDIVEPYVREALPKDWITPKTIWHINPTGKVLHRRSRWRFRPDRPQDHRRHLWWRGPAWRRCVLRQGSDQGRSFGGLRGALRRQEHRRGRSRRSLHPPARLRHRRRASAVDLHRHPRHR